MLPGWQSTGGPPPSAPVPPPPEAADALLAPPAPGPPELGAPSTPDASRVQAPTAASRAAIAPGATREDMDHECPTLGVLSTRRPGPWRYCGMGMAAKRVNRPRRTFTSAVVPGFTLATAARRPWASFTGVAVELDDDVAGRQLADLRAGDLVDAHAAAGRVGDAEAELARRLRLACRRARRPTPAAPSSSASASSLAVTSCRCLLRSERDLDRRAGRVLGDVARQLLGVRDGRAVHGDDHVAGADAGARRGAARLDLGDQRAARRVEVEGAREVRRERLEAEAEAAALDAALVAELAAGRP